MRKLLTTVAMLASLVAPALAADKNPTTILYQGGDHFATFKTKLKDTNEPTCGIMTFGTSSLGNTMMFSFKAVKSHDETLFILAKDSWRFGKDAKSVPFKVYFDDRKEWTVGGDGIGAGNGKDASLSLWVKGGADERQAFLDIFAHADTMYVAFDQGNENVWKITMAGSRDAVKAYRDCLPTIGIPSNTEESGPFSKTPEKEQGGESF